MWKWKLMQLSFLTNKILLFDFKLFKKIFSIASWKEWQLSCVERKLLDMTFLTVLWRQLASVFLAYVKVNSTFLARFIVPGHQGSQIQQDDSNFLEISTAIHLKFCTSAVSSRWCCRMTGVRESFSEWVTASDGLLCFTNLQQLVYVRRIQNYVLLEKYGIRLMNFNLTPFAFNARYFILNVCCALCSAARQ